jgi:hypothetical protein
MLDGRILFIMLPTLLWPRIYTLVPLVIVAGTLFYVERRLEMDVASALRAARSSLAGSLRPARPSPKQRRRVDYDRID